MQFLPKELFQGISEWLFPVDQMSLRWTSRVGVKNITHRMVIGSVTRSIWKRLNANFEINLSDMRRLRFSFLGPFLLECITGNDWSDGEITVMCDEARVEQVANTLDLDYELDSSSHSEVMFPTRFVTARNGRTVSIGFTGFINGYPRTLTERAVAQTLPFQFTRILFDGERTWIFDWNSIVERKALFSFCRFSARSFVKHLRARADFYTNNGFRVIG